MSDKVCQPAKAEPPLQADAPAPNLTIEVELTDQDATTAFGQRLGGLLFPGSVLALIGPLGAGKTLFVRAVALGLEIRDSRIVTSPTFVLIQEYDARLPIYHFDAYRLQGVRDFLDLGALEYFAASGVCLVEWADRVESCLPAEHLRMVFEVTGETTRRLKVSAFGEKYAQLLHNFTQSSTHPAASSRA